MWFYVAVAVRGFRRYATYRTATAAGIFTNTIFGFILAYTYLALWDQRPHLGGYDAAQAVTFVWLGQSLLPVCSILGGGFENELGERIRKGDVAIDLYRPADLQMWWLANDLGRAGFQLLGRGVVPTLAGAVAFSLTLPTLPVTWLWFLTSVLLAIIVSFGIRYLVALATFWLLDNAGVQHLSIVTCIFFSGMLLPLPLFPGWLGTLAQALPWSAILQIPADVLLGRHTGRGLALALGFQLGWALTLLALGRLMGAFATRKVVIQGG